jgi:nucleoside-diphosphate-sugar epimerase
LSRVLVTGASGFVGGAVAAALAVAGHEVRAAMRRPPSRPLLPGVEPALHGDLEADVAWGPLAAGMDFVVHNAGITHQRGITQARYDQVNRDATMQLAQAARNAGVKRLVLMSSLRAQAGPVSGHLRTEADEPRPGDPYGRSKLAGEIAVKDSGVPFTVLRPVLVYGVGAKGNLGRLIAAARAPVVLPLGAFTNPRSLIGLDNLAAAVLHVLRHPATIGQTYLVADPHPLSLAEMVAALRRGFGRRPGLIAMPPSLVRLAMAAAGRGADWPQLYGSQVVDPGKLIATGWDPDPDTAMALATLARRVANSSKA